MTCTCTNGRVPGNDWTQPAVSCPECSGYVRACPDCEPNNAAAEVLARVEVRVSDYALRAGGVGLLSPLVTHLLTGSETAAAMVMLAAFASVGTALWVLNVISGERRKS